jgi:hypothetical protein
LADLPLRSATFGVICPSWHVVAQGTEAALPREPSWSSCSSSDWSSNSFGGSSGPQCWSRRSTSLALYGAASEHGKMRSRGLAPSWWPALTNNMNGSCRAMTAASMDRSVLRSCTSSSQESTRRRRLNERAPARRADCIPAPTPPPVSACAGVVLPLRLPSNRIHPTTSGGPPRASVKDASASAGDPTPFSRLRGVPRRDRELIRKARRLPPPRTV